MRGFVGIIINAQINYVKYSASNCCAGLLAVKPMAVLLLLEGVIARDVH